MLYATGAVSARALETRQYCGGENVNCAGITCCAGLQCQYIEPGQYVSTSVRLGVFFCYFVLFLVYFPDLGSWLLNANRPLELARRYVKRS